MKTVYFKEPTKENIEAAARIIRDGGLLAIPTETVYGLGADALNEDAVLLLARSQHKFSHSCFMSPKIKYDQCHTDTDENVCHIEDRPDAEIEEVHDAADTHAVDGISQSPSEREDFLPLPFKFTALHILYNCFTDFSLLNNFSGCII